MEPDEAHKELLNWGHCNHDGWLANHALYAVPPTSEQYRPPTGDIYEDAPDADEPLDFQTAAITERIVVGLALEGSLGFEHHRVLVHYYTRLMVCHLPDDSVPLTRQQAIKRLSKHMHTSYSGAERMLREAQSRYWEKRLTVKSRRCRPERRKKA